MKVNMELQCKYCHVLLDHSTTLEAYQLHFQVEHDQDEVELNMVGICECGMVMEFVKTSQIGNTGGEADLFQCVCGKHGWVLRGKK